MIFACNISLQTAGLESVQIAVRPYMFYSTRTVMFKFIGIREEVYAPQLQLTFCVGYDPAVLPCGSGDGAVAQEALDCIDTAENALRNFKSTIFSKLHTLLENSQL